MELDATRREPNLNLSAQEFQWRRNTQRCLECAKTGHMIRECKNPKDCKGSYLLVERRKRTDKHLEKYAYKNPGNGSGKRQRGRRLGGVGKRRRLPVKDGLRSRPEQKPIILRNFYAAPNNTKLWENDKVHVMIKVNLHGKCENVSINAMIDSGATEDFIDKRICD